MALGIDQLFCRRDLLFTSATFTSAVGTSTVFTVSSFATFAGAGTIGIFHSVLFN